MHRWPSPKLTNKATSRVDKAWRVPRRTASPAGQGVRPAAPRCRAARREAHGDSVMVVIIFTIGSLVLVDVEPFMSSFHIARFTRTLH